ncbi:MAG: hypothetical protein PVG39_00130 [Desulfobacteraceae bacterium]|jgi:hypothetical protein
MKLDANRKITDHDLMTGIGEDDHHNRGTSVKVLINSQSISAQSAYEVRIDLGASGYRTFRVLLRGSSNVDIQGHTGVFVIAGGASEDCSGIGIEPYGAAEYTISYMGAYSRIHGDSYLSPIGTFGTNIALRDAYIDDNEAVLEFYNASVSTQDLKVYGTLVVK